MELLIISSCTKKKALELPHGMTLADMQDSRLRASREADLAAYRTPALDLYTGEQHLAVRRSATSLRATFGRNWLGVHIISALFGLVNEDEPLVPYNHSFNDMRPADAAAWSQKLGIPDAVRTAVTQAPVVMFLLGENYLNAMAPPIAPAPGQRFIFLAPKSATPFLSWPGTTVVPAGKEQATRYRAGLVALKGRMLELLAGALTHEGEALWDALRKDDTPATFEAAIYRQLAANLKEVG